MEADVAAANAFQGQLCGCFLCVHVLTYSKVMFMFSFLCLGPSCGRQVDGGGWAGAAAVNSVHKMQRSVFFSPKYSAWKTL